MTERAGAPARESQWLKISDGSLTIEVVARPGSSRTGIHRVAPQGLIVGVNAAPERGKASDELIAFVAKTTGVPRAAITIIRGALGRHKTIRIGSDTPATTAERLRSSVAAALRLP
jgi:uncharacterized protein